MTVAQWQPGRLRPRCPQPTRSPPRPGPAPAPVAQVVLLAIMLAAVGDTPYNIVYFVHIVSVILGTGMAFIAPMMATRGRRSAGMAVQEMVNEAAGRIMFPMFLLAGIAGGALVGLSSDFYDFSQTWLSIGGAVWIVVLGLTLAVYPPPWLRLFNPGEDRKAMFGGMLHLSIAIMLVLMVWKFGDSVGVG